MREGDWLRPRFWARIAVLWSETRARERMNDMNVIGVRIRRLNRDSLCAESLEFGL